MRDTRAPIHNVIRYYLYISIDGLSRNGSIHTCTRLIDSVCVSYKRIEITASNDD